FAGSMRRWLSARRLVSRGIRANPFLAVLTHLQPEKDLRVFAGSMRRWLSARRLVSRGFLSWITAGLRIHVRLGQSQPEKPAARPAPSVRLQRNGCVPTYLARPVRADSYQKWMAYDLSQLAWSYSSTSVGT